MPRPPSRTPFVILGLLTIEPMSGYDLKTNIDRSISQFWTESYGQLYPALKKLHGQGFVTRTEAGSGKRKRHVYAITDAGREELLGWLARPPAPRNVRNEMLLKLFFGRHVDRATLRGHLIREREQARGTLQGMTGAIHMLQETEADAPDLDYWLLTLDLGMRTAKARFEWAEASLQKLGELEG